MYCSHNRMINQEDETPSTCSIHGREHKSVQSFG